MILDLGRWKIDCDECATVLCYSAQPVGVDCDCADCRNFMAAAESAFPEEFRAIARQLGIDVSKPAELSHLCREPSGRHSSGGWFHLVGHIVAGSDAWTAVGTDCWTQALEPLMPGFEIGFSSRLALVPEAFRGQPVVQLEFKTSVPWVITDEESSGRRLTH